MVATCVSVFLQFKWNFMTIVCHTLLPHEWQQVEGKIRIVHYTEQDYTGFCMFTRDCQCPFRSGCVFGTAAIAGFQPKGVNCNGVIGLFQECSTAISTQQTNISTGQMKHSITAFSWSFTIITDVRLPQDQPSTLFGSDALPLLVILPS